MTLLKLEYGIGLKGLLGKQGGGATIYHVDYVYSIDGNVIDSGGIDSNPLLSCAATKPFPLNSNACFSSTVTIQKDVPDGSHIITLHATGYVKTGVGIVYVIPYQRVTRLDTSEILYSDFNTSSGSSSDFSSIASFTLGNLPQSALSSPSVSSTIRTPVESVPLTEVSTIQNLMLEPVTPATTPSPTPSAPSLDTNTGVHNITNSNVNSPVAPSVPLIETDANILPAAAAQIQQVALTNPDKPVLPITTTQVEINAQEKIATSPPAQENKFEFFTDILTGEIPKYWYVPYLFIGAVIGIGIGLAYPTKLKSSVKDVTK